VKPPPTEVRVIRPPQFGLRTLLLIVTACGVLFALANWLEPIAWVGVLLLVSSVTLHVAGNAIGTRLRQLGDRPPDAQMESPALRGRRPLEFAPVTRLSLRQSLGWSIVLATALGTLVGGAGGGVWTWISSRGPAGLLQLAVGVIAFAVLGGLAAFGAAAFTQVLLGAMWQALHAPSATGEAIAPHSLASAEPTRDNRQPGH
jgi:hypothetical protein